MQKGMITPPCAPKETKETKEIGDLFSVRPAVKEKSSKFLVASESFVNTS
jgi:hypothetical protein